MQVVRRTTFISKFEVPFGTPRTTWDTEKVPGTVVAALYAFFDRHPGAIVYATGSTPGRTRLYRMGITKFYEEIKNDFYLYGQLGYKLYIFEEGVEYEGFVAQRKFE